MAAAEGDTVQAFVGMDALLAAAEGCDSGTELLPAAEGDTGTAQGALPAGCGSGVKLEDPESPDWDSGAEDPESPTQGEDAAAAGELASLALADSLPLPSEVGEIVGGGDHWTNKEDVARFLKLAFFTGPGTWEEAVFKTKHRHNNRYNNILPLVGTRVQLTAIWNRDVPLRHAFESDYFNADFVWGPGERPATPPFVVTQGPLACTIEQFWWAVFQQGTSVIVMLANIMEGGKLKVDWYFPASLRQSVRLGLLEVTLLAQCEEDGIHIRQFQVQIAGDPESARVVYHIQCTNWPDHGVPESTCGIQRIMTLTRHFCAGDGPVFVHCSAGIGRSGVFAAAEILDRELERGTPFRELDVVGTVEAMRGQRAGCIQTSGQFEFLCRLLRAREAYWERVCGSPEASVTTDISSDFEDPVEAVAEAVAEAAAETGAAVEAAAEAVAEAVAGAVAATEAGAVDLTQSGEKRRAETAKEGPDAKRHRS